MNDIKTTENKPYKYWAFISYSHKDENWGTWLHKNLESYRVPGKLVGRETRGYKVPKRVFPVFRDREELPTSTSLTDNITDALRQSRYLIVICSPRSAISTWVSEEIKYFKSLGREDRVLCLIVDGEPNASDKPDCDVPECFPEALRFRMGKDGELTNERTEPIAADAREGKDEKNKAKLKILAGLLGVGFDELYERDKKRRKRNNIIGSTLGALFFLTISGLGAFSYYQWEMSESRLVEMLMLRGNQERKNRNWNESLTYYSELLSKRNNFSAIIAAKRSLSLFVPEICSFNTENTENLKTDKEKTRWIMKSCHLPEDYAKLFTMADGFYDLYDTEEKSFKKNKEEGITVTAKFLHTPRWSAFRSYDFKIVDKNGEKLWEFSPYQAVAISEMNNVMVLVDMESKATFKTFSLDFDGKGKKHISDEIISFVISDRGSAVTSMTLQQSPGLVAFGTEDGIIKIAGIGAGYYGDPIVTIDTGEEIIVDLAFSDDGKTLLTCMNYGDVCKFYSLENIYTASLDENNFAIHGNEFFKWYSTNTSEFKGVLKNVKDISGLLHLRNIAPYGLGVFNEKVAIFGDSEHIYFVDLVKKSYRTIKFNEIADIIHIETSRDGMDIAIIGYMGNAYLIKSNFELSAEPQKINLRKMGEPPILGALFDRSGRYLAIEAYDRINIISVKEGNSILDIYKGIETTPLDYSLKKVFVDDKQKFINKLKSLNLL